MNSIEIISIYSDGASRGNPGPAAYGYVFVQDEEVIHRDSGYLGVKTNNQAEYLAVKNALKKAKERGYSKISYHSDSQLVINQLNGDWKIRDRELKQIYKDIQDLIVDLEVDFVHLGRENYFISLADDLCNKVLDKEK